MSVTAHNNYTRAQSQGQRPQNCNVGRASSNPLDMLFGIQNAAQGLIDKAERLYNNPLGAAIDATYGLLDWTTRGHNYLFRGGLVNEIKNLTWEKALGDLNLARRGGLGIAASVVIGATPLLGSLYDAASLQLGYDPITGVPLTGFEQAAITAGLTAGLLGGLSFLDEAAEISAKMARHLDNIDVVDVAKAGRGLGHVDELSGAAKAGRIADELADVAGLGRHIDEALDAATATRLRNLDAFTGGSQTTRSADEVRASIRNQSGQGALSRRLNAAAAHRKAGNDLNDPSVRYMINRGLGPIQGGSGASVRGIDGLEWDPRVNNWRDPNTGQFVKRPQGAWGNVRVRHTSDEPTDLREVQILGFRGIGFSGITPELQAQHTLIKAGHIGVSFDGGKTIFGFHPHPNSGAQILEFGTVSPVEFAKHGGAKLLVGPDKLPFSGGAFRGTVQNDTEVFKQANALFEKGVVGAKGKTTEVWQLDVQVSKEHFEQIQTQVLREVEAGSPYPSWYRFPDRRPGVVMPRQCNNCATWPRTLGLPIPEKTGQLSIYIDELKIAGGETMWKPK